MNTYGIDFSGCKNTKKSQTEWFFLKKFFKQYIVQWTPRRFLVAVVLSRRESRFCDDALFAVWYSWWPFPSRIRNRWGHNSLVPILWILGIGLGWLSWSCLWRFSGRGRTMPPRLRDASRRVYGRGRASHWRDTVCRGGFGRIRKYTCRCRVRVPLPSSRGS